MLVRQQISAARGLLGWDQKTLAAKAGATPAQISEIESGKRKASLPTLESIHAVLTKAGVVFVDDGAPSLGGGPGVRLRK